MEKLRPRQEYSLPIISERHPSDDSYPFLPINAFEALSWADEIFSQAQENNYYIKIRRIGVENFMMEGILQILPDGSLKIGFSKISQVIAISVVPTNLNNGKSIQTIQLTTNSGSVYLLQSWEKR